MTRRNRDVVVGLFFYSISQGTASIWGLRLPFILLYFARKGIDLGASTWGLLWTLILTYFARRGMEFSDAFLVPGRSRPAPALRIDTF